MDLEESGENRLMLGQKMASDTGIKVYRQMSVNQNDGIQEAIDAIMMTVNEP